MRNLECLGLRCIENRLMVLDQTLLPYREEWLPCRELDEMVRFIQGLCVRGAPLIGVAAAVFLACYAKKGASVEELVHAAGSLRKARPTAVNLRWAMDRMVFKRKKEDIQAEVLTAEAERIFDEDVEMCETIAKNGMGLFSDGDNIITHCNAGGLATAGIGTALGVIRRVHESGKRIHVFVDETRPLLQGARLTAWELHRLGIPYTLICDNMAASLMKAGKIQKVITGADRIAMNGDAANKIGTYGLAVQCHFHRIPFYIAAPYSTLDHACPSGEKIPIEEREPDEVRGARGHFGNVCWSPLSAPAWNPAFDVTPKHLITGFILDRGFFSRDAIQHGALSSY